MLYTAKQVYQKLNKAIGINQIRAMMASGEIPAVMQKNRWVTTEEHVNRYVERINMRAKENAENMRNAFAVAKY